MDSKPESRTETVDVNAAGISGKVAHITLGGLSYYPGGAADSERIRDEATEVSQVHDRLPTGSCRSEHDRARAGWMIVKKPNTTEIRRTGQADVGEAGWNPAGHVSDFEECIHAVADRNEAATSRSAWINLAGCRDSIPCA